MEKAQKKVNQTRKPAQDLVSNSRRKGNEKALPHHRGHIHPSGRVVSEKEKKRVKKGGKRGRRAVHNYIMRIPATKSTVRDTKVSKQDDLRERNNS